MSTRLCISQSFLIIVILGLGYVIPTKHKQSNLINQLFEEVLQLRQFEIRHDVPRKRNNVKSLLQSIIDGDAKAQGLLPSPRNVNVNANKKANIAHYNRYQNNNPSQLHSSYNWKTYFAAVKSLKRQAAASKKVDIALSPAEKSIADRIEQIKRGATTTDKSSDVIQKHVVPNIPNRSALNRNNPLKSQKSSKTLGTNARSKTYLRKEKLANSKGYKKQTIDNYLYQYPIQYPIQYAMPYPTQYSSPESSSVQSIIYSQPQFQNAPENYMTELAQSMKNTAENDLRDHKESQPQQSKNITSGKNITKSGGKQKKVKILSIVKDDNTGLVGIIPKIADKESDNPHPDTDIGSNQFEAVFKQAHEGNSTYGGENAFHSHASSSIDLLRLKGKKPKHITSEDDEEKSDKPLGHEKTSSEKPNDINYKSAESENFSNKVKPPDNKSLAVNKENDDGTDPVKKLTKSKVKNRHKFIKATTSNATISNVSASDVAITSTVAALPKKEVDPDNWFDRRTHALAILGKISSDLDQPDVVDNVLSALGVSDILKLDRPIVQHDEIDGSDDFNRDKNWIDEELGEISGDSLGSGDHTSKLHEIDQRRHIKGIQVLQDNFVKSYRKNHSDNKKESNGNIVED